MCPDRDDAEVEHSRRHHAVYCAFELVVVLVSILLGMYAIERLDPHPFNAAVLAIGVWELFVRSHTLKYGDHFIGVLKPELAGRLRNNA